MREFFKSSQPAPHFTGGSAKAREGQPLAQGHTPRKGQRGPWPCWLVPSPLLSPTLTLPWRGACHTSLLCALPETVPCKPPGTRASNRGQVGSDALCLCHIQGFCPFGAHSEPDMSPSHRLASLLHLTDERSQGPQSSVTSAKPPSKGLNPNLMDSKACVCHFHARLRRDWECGGYNLAAKEPGESPFIPGPVFLPFK